LRRETGLGHHLEGDHSQIIANESAVKEIEKTFNSSIKRQLNEKEIISMSSPEAALQTMIQNLEAQTGKSFAEWIKIAQATKLTKVREILNYLKTEHGLTYGYANTIALKALKSDAGSSNPDDLVSTQYSGPKAQLKPIYETLLSAVQKFGDDVEVAPKKAYVSLRRKKQFACFQPSTATRMDVGINLKDTPATARLELSGSFNSMVSHRVRVTKKEEVDKELIGWLRKAYDQS
jgi:predicted transport protein